MAATPPALLIRSQSLSPLGRLSRFLMPYRARIAAAMLALILAAAGVLALGQGLRHVIDAGFASGNPQPLNAALAGLLDSESLVDVAALPLAGTLFYEVYGRSCTGQTIYRAKGCEACDGTGYQGRSGIFELLVIDDDLRRAINEKKSQQDQFEIARAKGFRNYREDGADKILAGITSVDEVLSAS